MSKIRNNLFYLLDKHELNRSYGDFRGWGSALSQFQDGFGSKNNQNQAQSLNDNPLRRFRSQNTLQLPPVNVTTEDIQIENYSKKADLNKEKIN